MGPSRNYGNAWRVEEKLIALNCGSGQRPFSAPFQNIDINSRWKPDIVADCSSLPMFADNSVDLIVSHQNVEHVGCGESAPMLKEWRRILKPGGSLIISVPHMQALAQAWLNGKLTTQVYMTAVYGAFMDHEADRHRWGYDESSLRKFMRSCGFDTAKKFDWREIEGASIARDFWILCLEGIK